MSEHRVAVVVPTHNRADHLPRLLRALERQTLAPEEIEVVVVDDGSDDGTAEVVERWVASTPLQARAVRLARSAGPAAARNVGWRATTAGAVAFTDDDCEPEPHWLAQGLSALSADPELGIVQGRTIPQEGDRRTWSATREIVTMSPYFEGCNLVLRRAALEAAGGFDETLGMGCEDTALGWEVVTRGWGRTFVPDAVVRHAVTDPGPRWHIRQGLMRANVVAVAKRYPQMRLEFWRPWALAPRSAAFAAAAAGVVAGAVWRPALLLTAPYAWINRPYRPADTWAKRTVALGIQDTAALAGMIRGCLRYRIVVV